MLQEYSAINNKTYNVLPGSSAIVLLSSLGEVGHFIGSEINGTRCPASSGDKATYLCPKSTQLLLCHPFNDVHSSHKQAWLLNDIYERGGEITHKVTNEPVGQLKEPKEVLPVTTGTECPGAVVRREDGHITELVSHSIG